MALKRTIVTRGNPIVSEDFVAASTVKPGYLVQVNSSSQVAHQAVAAANVARMFALERDELGTGIDNTYQGSGTGTAFYAAGDAVKVATFKPGERLIAFVASGQDISVGEKLEAAGDGTLRALASGTPLAEAREAHAPNVTAADGAIEVEVF